MQGGVGQNDLPGNNGDPSSSPARVQAGQSRDQPGLSWLSILLFLTSCVSWQVN